MQTMQESRHLSCRSGRSAKFRHPSRKNTLTCNEVMAMRHPMRRDADGQVQQMETGEPGSQYQMEQRVQMNIVSLVSPKGGTGKSSLATAIAAAASEGRALLCDLAGGAFGPLVEVLKPSDLVLVPLRPSLPDLTTITRLKGFTESLPVGECAGRMAVVLSQADGCASGRPAFSRSVLEGQAGVNCCRTHISQSLAWPDACGQGLDVQESRPVRYRQAANRLRQLWTEMRDMVRQQGSRS